MNATKTRTCPLVRRGLEDFAKVFFCLLRGSWCLCAFVANFFTTNTTGLKNRKTSIYLQINKKL